MSSDAVIEDVPPFVRRHGDYVVQGSNNTIIIMGTDRAASGPAGIGAGLGHVKADSKGAGAGTIHIIAGRSGKDPDMKDDAAFLYLSKKTKADTNLNVSDVEKANDERPSAILKSNVVRIVGREDIKICANDDVKHYIYLDGKKITVKIEDNTIEMDKDKIVITRGNTIWTMDGSLVKIDAPKVHLVGGCGKPWNTIFEKIDAFASTHNHMSAVGPTTTVVTGPTATTATDVKTAYSGWKSDVAPA